LKKIERSKNKDGRRNLVLFFDYTTIWYLHVLNTITNSNYSDKIVNADYSSNEIENENNDYRMRIKSDQELNKFPNQWQPKIIHIKKIPTQNSLKSNTGQMDISNNGWLGRTIHF
jgi:hypothetical protein